MSTVGKKKHSQQLVEFLLVVPFMVIILGILTEYAYALNVNLTIAQAIKTATSAGYMVKGADGTDHYLGTYSQIGPQNSATDSRKFIVDKVTAGFIQYLIDNNVPHTTENNISVNALTIGSTTIFVASYTYVPAFTLPNVFFKILPDKFDFSAAAAVPTAFLGDNSAYVGSNAYDTNDLNQIWASGGDLANIDSFDSGKKGAMNGNYLPGSAGEILYLSYFSTLASGDVRPAPLIKPYELAGRVRTAVDMANGALYTWDKIDYDCSYTDSDGIYHPATCSYIQLTYIGPFARDIENHPYYQVMFDPAELSLGGTNNYDEIPTLSGYEIKHYGSIKIVRPTTLGVDIGVIAPNPKDAGYNFNN